MSAELVKRADAIRAEFKKLESVRGSGYHDDDRNPARNDLFLAPQRNGLARASESVVHFTDHDDEVVHFIAVDASRALAALQCFAKRYAKADTSGLPGTVRKLLVRIIPKLKLETVSAQSRLSVRLADWNDVLFALQAEGLGLAGAPLEE